MRFTVPRYLRPVLLGLTGCAVLLYLASTGSTQPGDKPAVGKTSYDQVSPALTGQESFAGDDGQGQGRQGGRSWPARRRCWKSATTCRPDPTTRSR